jgi:hypothetical protein
VVNPQSYNIFRSPTQNQTGKNCLGNNYFIHLNYGTILVMTAGFQPAFSTAITDKSLENFLGYVTILFFVHLEEFKSPVSRVVTVCFIQLNYKCIFFGHDTKN